MRNNMTTVAIIGYGELGKALGKLLEQGGSIVHFWDKEETKVPEQRTLTDTMSAANTVFLCVPSWAVREALSELMPHLHKDSLVVGLSKGIEEGTLKTMDQLLTEVLPTGQPWVLMSGPMIAEELVAGKPGAAVVASSDKANFDRLSPLFSGTSLMLEFSADVHGVALAGVLKNIYAIGAGIIDALDFGWNAKGWYLGRSASEMEDIVEKLGGVRETALGTAGLADLVATGCSPQSRNHQTGAELVRTGKCCLKGEGSTAFPSVRALLGDAARAHPIFSALTSILADNQPASEVFPRLLLRVQK